MCIFALVKTSSNREEMPTTFILCMKAKENKKEKQERKERK